MVVFYYGLLSGSDELLWIKVGWRWDIVFDDVDVGRSIYKRCVVQD